MTETKTITLDCSRGPKKVEAGCVGEWGIHVAIYCTCGKCWRVTHIESGMAVPSFFRKKNAVRQRTLAQSLVVSPDGAMEKDQRAAGRKMMLQCRPLSAASVCW